MFKILLSLLKGGNKEKTSVGNLAWEIREAIKGKELDPNQLLEIQTKINEVDAIGKGVKDLYKTGENPFVAISAGTGTACIYHANGKFNYLGGISIGGGTLQGLSKHLINNTNNEEIQELAITGNRKELDYLIGDIANEIGSLNSEITASNFAKAKNLDRLSSNDVAASITNMIGEVIGTVAYLNAMLCGENKVYFLGRVSLNINIKAAIEDRLKLADITGIFEDNREYGNVLGALAYLKDFHSNIT